VALQMPPQGESGTIPADLRGQHRGSIPEPDFQFRLNDNCRGSLFPPRRTQLGLDARLQLFSTPVFPVASFVIQDDDRVPKTGNGCSQEIVGFEQATWIAARMYEESRGNVADAEGRGAFEKTAHQVFRVFVCGQNREVYQ